MGARFRILVLGLCIVIGILIASWEISPDHDTRSNLIVQATPPSQAPFDYVVNIVMNNASAIQVYGVSAAPYMNSLASTYGYATSYSDVAVSVSDPNYIALIGGSTFGLSADCYPTACPVNSVNIVDHIEAAGLTWKAWAEDYPVSQGCSLSPSNAEYNSKHLPFLYFQDIINTPTRCSHLLRANSVVSSSIETDDLFLKSLGSTSSAANYNWLTPNQCDDLHDCPLSIGDKYLSQLVPKILSSYIFTTHNAALFVTFAESSGSSIGYVPAIWAGPVVKTKFQSSKSYNHYSLLSTIETAWGLSSLTSNDGFASAMTEFFRGMAPQATISYTPSHPAAGDSVSFNANVVDGAPPYTFSWNFGDTASNVPGGTSLPNTTTHTYASPGTYIVTVNATDTNGKTGSASSTIAVVAPLAVIVSGPFSANVGSSATFVASASGGTSPYSFSWTFGDATNLATGGTASHKYAVAGTYTVKVNATDATGRLAQASAIIAINPPSLMVAVTGSSLGEVGLALNLTATASGGTQPYTSFSWDFGDGSTGSGNPVAHVYTASGTYSVTVAVKDSAGVTATSPSHFVALAARLQVSSVSTTPNLSEAGSPISFSATISGGVSPVSCSWSFGDGSFPASGCSNTHAYASAATFTATVTVTDTLGLTATSSSTITVNPKLTLIVTTSASNPVVGQSLTFTAAISGGVGAVNCSWNFGDAITSTGCTITHTYTTSGAFTAAVTATDTLTVIASASVTLTVGSGLAVILVISPNPTELTVNTTFTATARGGMPPYASYSWTFGDATTATTTTATTSHAYTSTGTFSATVTVTDSVGRTATYSVSVTVKAKLAVTAAASPNPTEVGVSAGFTAPTTDGIGAATCTWIFGDGSGASECSASHTYTTTGAFNATVTATDTLGVTATNRVSVTLNARLTLAATAGPNPTDDGVLVSFVPVSAGGVGGITCTWNFGDTSGGLGCSSSHTYISAGSFTAIITATDGVGVTVAASVTVTVNPSPRVDFNLSPTKPIAGQSVIFTATTTGGSSPFTLSWNYGDGSPDSSGNPSIHTYAAPGIFKVNLTAKDANMATTVTTLTISVAENKPPVFSSMLALQKVSVGQALAFTVVALDPEGEPVSIAAENLPSAASFDPGTGLFSWTPTADETGNYSITFIAIDSGTPPVAASQTITIQVRPGPGQICLNCSRTLGLPIDDGVVASLGFLGSISALLATILVGMRDKGELDTVGPAANYFSRDDAREAGIQGQDQIGERMEDEFS